MVALLTQPDRYLITPEVGPDPKLFLQRIERALAAGNRRIQLRSGPCKDIGALATQVLARCAPHHAQLLVNGDVGLAARLKCGVR